MNPPLPVKSFWRWGIAALVLVIPLLASPLVLLALVAIAPEKILDFAAVAQVIRDPANLELARFTLVQAEASTVLALAVGLPAAHVVAHVRFPGRRILRGLLTVPIVLPPLVVALGFRELLIVAGREETGSAPILLAHTCFGVAIVVRVVAGAWAHLDPRHEEAARMLGASRLHAFASITLPALLPALLSAIALVFAFAFTSFGVVLVLGGGKDTIEMAVYRIALDPESAPIAATLGLLQLLITIPLLALYAGSQRYLTARARVTLTPGRSLRQTSWRERIVVLLVLVAAGILVIAPIAAVIRGAITINGTLTTAYFDALMVPDADRRLPSGALRWSILIAAGSAIPGTFVGAMLGIAVARARRGGTAVLAALYLLPLALPTVTIAFAYLITWQNDAPYSVPQAYAILLAAHAMIVAPFALRAVVGPARAADPREREAATVLGASSGRAWRVIEWPLVRRAMVYGGALAFAMSLGETGATLLLARPEFSSIPILIARALGDPSTEALGAVLALGTMLLALAVVAFVIIERLRPRDVGEF